MDDQEKQQARNVLGNVGMEGFDDFTTRHSEMKYSEDVILNQQQDRHSQFEEWKESG